jgi:hypothetical protein
MQTLLQLRVENVQALGGREQPREVRTQGDKPMEARVLSLVDDSHATAAELFDDPVVRDGPADHWDTS